GNSVGEVELPAPDQGEEDDFRQDAEADQAKPDEDEAGGDSVGTGAKEKGSKSQNEVEAGESDHPVGPDEPLALSEDVPDLSVDGRDQGDEAGADSCQPGENEAADEILLGVAREEGVEGPSVGAKSAHDGHGNQRHTDLWAVCVPRGPVGRRTW